MCSLAARARLFTPVCASPRPCQVRVLLSHGANPLKRTLPDANFPEGATPLKATTSKEVKKALRARIKEITTESKAAEALGNETCAEEVQDADAQEGSKDEL